MQHALTFLCTTFFVIWTGVFPHRGNCSHVHQIFPHKRMHYIACLLCKYDSGSLTISTVYFDTHFDLHAIYLHHKRSPYVTCTCLYYIYRIRYYFSWLMANKFQYNNLFNIFMFLFKFVNLLDLGTKITCKLVVKPYKTNKQSYKV